MSTATKTRRTRAYVQKSYAPGDVLLWADWDGTERIGTVWSDGPKVGTRWMLEDDGTVTLVKPWMSGRRAGEVYQEARHEPGWQRRVTAMLDLLNRSHVWTSEHQEPYGDLPGTYTAHRVHVDGDCAAETDSRDRHSWHYFNADGIGGAWFVRDLLRGDTDHRGNERDPHRAVILTLERLCPKCAQPVADDLISEARS